MSVVSLFGRRCLEVGWAVRQELRGRRHASEVGRAAMELASGDLEAHEVVAFTELHNVNSRQVIERLGMTYMREICRPGLVSGSQRSETTLRSFWTAGLPLVAWRHPL